jgi:polyisoprenoid-binding protein YceI
VVGLGVLGTAALVILFVFFLGGSDDPVSLESAVAGVTSTPPTGADSTAATTTTAQAPANGVDSTAATTTTAQAPASDGTWTVAAGLDSFVGYRVQEELDPLGSSTATGRTRAVEGQLIIDGASITAVEVVADVSQLQSDRGSRDRALRSRGLESDDFPQASFTLTTPIALAAAPQPGESIMATALGDLTAHGVTNPVEVQLEAQLVDDVIAVVGTIEVKLSDFEISGLTGFAVLSVEDEAVVELQLFFSR